MKTIIEKRDGDYDRAGIGGWLASALHMLPNGRYELSVEKSREPRSLNQNALMWMWFEGMAKILTEYTGEIYNKMQIHDHYVAKLLRTPDPLQNGEYVVRSTSRLTKKEMSDFLDAVQADAATEYGITLPSPGDRGYEVFETMYG